MNPNETTNGVSLPTFLKLIDTALVAIIEMEDANTLDEQMDCIVALKNLRNKLKDKEELK